MKAGDQGLLTPRRRTHRLSLATATVAAAFAFVAAPLARGEHAPYTTNCFWANTSSSCPGGITNPGWESSWSGWNSSNMVVAWSASVPYETKRVWMYPSPSGPAVGPWAGGNGAYRFAIQPYATANMSSKKGKCGNAGIHQQALACAIQLGAGH